MNGFVLWFSKIKGYGFIRPEDGSKDIFVHFSGINSNGKKYKVLEEGQVVEFEVADSGNAKGRTATKVTPTGKFVTVSKEGG